MKIRAVVAEDEGTVLRLWRRLLKFYDKEASQEVLERSFRYVVDHPHQVLVFVALVDGVIAGTASLHQGHYSTWNDNWYGHIEDVIVDPEYRGRGVGSKLLSHIIQVAREKNLARLELNALNSNGPARKMYEKLGFTTDSAAYELPLR
jgi:ribosomal protein S18 acetylase RimI-like enzyme